MSDDFSRLSQQISPARLDLARAIARLSEATKKAIQRKSRVASGRLRSSWSVSLSVDGAKVGSSVSYVQYQKNDPVREGLEASTRTIEESLVDLGEDFLKGVK